MGANDAGVDHEVLVVAVLGQGVEDPLPDSRLRPPGVPAVDVLPAAETLRQVAPRNTGTVAVEHGFDEESVVPGGGAAGPLATGQQVADGMPLVVTKAVAMVRQRQTPRTGWDPTRATQPNNGYIK